MVNTSKILTVSYGTFSCTLEGFDDSFETMKAIAEYFRDLAADDRYFGAEPPVPDAEMLARIAEREISRRVEAREEKGNIVLRAAQQGEMPALNAPMVAPVATQPPTPTPTQPTPSQPAPQAETPPVAADMAAHTATADDAGAVDDTAQPEPMTDAPAQQEAEDVLPDDMPVRSARRMTDGDESTIAAKLQRIRAVVSRNTAVSSEYSEDEHADIYNHHDTAALDAVLTEDEAEDAPTLAPAPAQTAAELPDDDDGPLTETPAETAVDTQAVAEPAVADDDALAQDEAQIEEDAPVEETVTQSELSDTPTMVVSGQETPDAEQPDTSAQQDDWQFDAPISLEDEVEDGAHEGETEDASVLDNDITAQDAADTTDIEATAQEDVLQDTEQAAPETWPQNDGSDDDDVAAILDRLAGLSDTPEPAAPAAAYTAQDYGDTGVDMDSLLADMSAPSDEMDTALTTQAPEEPPQDVTVAPPETAQPLRARVVKMKRADFEAAIAEGHLEEADDEGAFDDDWSAVDDSALSPEEEAELQAELAEVEAELEQDEAAPEDDGEEIDSIFAEGLDDTPYPGDRRRALDQLDEAASERDMTRLMAKTISEMDEPESTSRRNAIAHLRAAVAATRADKAAGVTERPDTISDAFRDDLASVVRPRRPRAEGTSTARPAEQSRPAPLKLVAEQRIDAPATPAAPVRPRRVSMTDIQQEARPIPATTEAGSTFADYVEEKGAHDLPEILEAAASFLSFVEGRDQFSRPQLMTRARSVVGDDFSREDGLRSFGQLLRQGKIQKLKGGRFTVSEQIGFQPSERRAG